MILTYTCRQCGRDMAEEIDLEGCEQKAIDYMREWMLCPECSVKDSALKYLAAIEERDAISEKRHRVNSLISTQEPCLNGIITGEMTKLFLELRVESAVEGALKSLLYSAKRLRLVRENSAA